MALTRFWFEFRGVSRGYGVTAYSREDALEILRQDAFDGELPLIEREIEDVDVSTLDANHVLANMRPPSWRGIWYPLGHERFAGRF